MEDDCQPFEYRFLRTGTLEWKTENRNLHRANPLTMAQIGEKPNPNNPIVFFDITVGNTVSSFISSHKILKLAWFKWSRLMLLPRIRELKEFYLSDNKVP